MKTEQFKKDFLTDVKIRIANREQCYEFQRIAFEFGVKVHSCMYEEEQTPIAYNIADLYPEYKGRSFANDMHNLVIYDNGTRMQQSAFWGLEDDKKEIFYDDLINAYQSTAPPHYH